MGKITVTEFLNRISRHLLHSLYEAFSPESELALAMVLADLQLPFTLSAFQVFATNALLNQVDVVGILPTGSGKTLVFYLYTCALRKLPAGFKSFPPSVKQGGLVLVSMPLSMLIQAQLSNPYGCKVATLSSGTTTEFCVPDHWSQAVIMAKFWAFMLNPDLFRTTFLTFPDF